MDTKGQVVSLTGALGTFNLEEHIRSSKDGIKSDRDIRIVEMIHAEIVSAKKLDPLAHSGKDLMTSQERRCHEGDVGPKGPGLGDRHSELKRPK